MEITKIMIQNSKRNIFIYNKSDELTTYAEFDSDWLITGYYNLKDRVFTKANVFKFKEKNKIYTDTNKTKTMFGEDCKLFHMFFDADDSYCRVIKKGSMRIELPVAISTIHSHNEDSIEAYTVNPSIIQSWLKKL